jgi:hypothetical protein
MKTGKMAPQPDRDEPKIKMRCGINLRRRTSSKKIFEICKKR